MNQIAQRISDIGVVPVIKLNHPERDAAPLAKALCEGGLPVAEVTFRAAGAANAIRLMAETCPEMLVGAGTVLTTAQVDEALAAGAKFIVTPVWTRRSFVTARRRAWPYSPAAPLPPITTPLTSWAWRF